MDQGRAEKETMIPEYVFCAEEVNGSEILFPGQAKKFGQ